MFEDWSGLERYQNLLDDGHTEVKAPPRWVPQLVSVEYLNHLIQKGTLNINPPHQRHVVHDTEWKSDIISSILETGCIPETFWHPSPGNPYSWDSVDGKQRCSALVEYCSNDYKWNKRYFRDLPSVLQGQILNFQITLNKADRTLTDSQLRDTFVRFQVTKQTRLGEVWNSDRCDLQKKLRQFVDEDKDKLHDKGVFKKQTPDRYQLLELYGTLFAYYVTGHVGITRRAIENNWNAHRNLSNKKRAITEQDWNDYRRHVRDMWDIIESSPKGKGHVSTRVRPLFGTLLCVRPGMRQAVVTHLCSTLSTHETLYPKIGGDHKGHHQRMKQLMISVEKALAEQVPGGVFI